LIIDIAILNAGACTIAPEHAIDALIAAHLAVGLRNDNFAVCKAQRTRVRLSKRAATR
jgi:hypothetical protein